MSHASDPLGHAACTSIVNVDGYTSDMSKSVGEKAFFVDRLHEPIDVFVDYGCADGVLLAHIYDKFPHARFVGYDSCPEMLKRANALVPTHPRMQFVDSWEQIAALCAGKTAAVMLGSTETTFYTISVYFGASGIRDTRHTVFAALLADCTGFFMACLTTRLFLS